MLRYLLMPVPAGMSLPMITFSLRPISESLRAWIAASVSTRVVSWNDAADGRLASLGDHAAVLRLEVRPVNQQTRQELGRAGVDDRDPLEHLPNDDLDVLVVDLYALRPVHLLDLLGQVDLHRPRTQYPQQLVRVDGALGDLLADLDVVAVGHPQPDPLGDLVVHDLVAAVVGHDDDLPSPVAILDPHPAGHLRDGRLSLGYPRLEDLLDTRQTLGDVLTRDATGVEGTHRQLGTRLTDRLGGDDADRLADVHGLAGRQRTAVAGRADAQLRLAGEHAAHPDGLHAGRDQLGHRDRVEVLAALRDELTVRTLDVVGQRPGVRPGLGVLVHDELVGELLADRHRDGPVGTAVLLADDHVLRHVHQPPGEVPGVGGTQRGVGQTLAGAVRGDEVLQHGQPLAEAGLDRPRDDLALRVGHEPSDRRDLPELEQVTASTRVDHLPQRVLLGQRRLHLLADLV